MTKVTSDMAISLDGYAAGPNQSADNPFGEGVGDRLHRWMFEAPDENTAEIEAITTAGAYVMGRNMFGPGRGAWDLDWKGWWGDEPPYHGPVFVLTHHPREPLAMEGGTTFTFVTDGIESALAQARAAAGGRDVAIAGGAETVRQYLAAGLIDELRLHVAPVILGAGERLLDGVPDARAAGRARHAARHPPALPRGATLSRVTNRYVSGRIRSWLTVTRDRSRRMLSRRCASAACG